MSAETHLGVGRSRVVAATACIERALDAGTTMRGYDRLLRVICIGLGRGFTSLTLKCKRFENLRLGGEPDLLLPALAGTLAPANSPIDIAGIRSLAKLRRHECAMFLPRPHHAVAKAWRVHNRNSLS
jgi:hypothetical protein